ncbi:MAG: RNA polymerase sigma-70 factor [Chloroflexi bacterium]|nr:RNA polymerase sigma-70 factor [Chloroflexota bacterium]
MRPGSAAATGGADGRAAPAASVIADDVSFGRGTSLTQATLDAQLFEAYRPLLFGVAYRMLGSVCEAEDIVQEALTRFVAARPERVESPRAFLVTVVTRLCLDHLKSARVQREQYLGPWLPEPLLAGPDDPRVSPEGAVAARESVTMAFLVLLESLGAVERAVFLLHEVFDFSHAEVAAIVGRSEAACRQLFHRATERVKAGRPRFAPAYEEVRRLTDQFMVATGTGDLDGLMRMLAEDITAWSDGGGKVAAAINPVVGADRVARLVLGGLAKELPDRAEVRDVNGQPAILAWRRGRLINVMAVEVGEGRIVGLRTVRNPEKLARLTVAAGG